MRRSLLTSILFLEAVAILAHAAPSITHENDFLVPTANGAKRHHRHRHLEGDRRAGLRDDDWITLECNANIGTANCTEHKFSDLDFLASPVTIPCGECYTMDVGGDLDLEGGLEIIGKLYIPDDAPKVKISAPFIYVQGVLKVEKNQIVTGDSLSVEFYITAPLGDGEQDRVIMPYNDDNKGACPETGCDVGKVPFVVAGGTVDIKALPPNCPAWVKLQDLVREPPPIPTDFPVATPAPPSCSRYVVSEDFSSGLKNGWRGNIGAKFQVVDDGSGSNKVLKVTNRKRTWQGPFLDLVEHRSCFKSDTMYLTLARVRLSKADGSEPLCVSSQESCPYVTMWTKKADNRDQHRRLATQSMAPLAGMNGWFTIEGKFSLTPDEASSNAVHQIVYIEGPEAGVDIELDSFQIMLPPETRYPNATAPNDICLNLFPYPSGTDFSYPLYPLTSTSGSRSTPQVMTETLEDNTVNSFLRLANRSNPWDSFAFVALASCMKEGITYEAKGSFRLHSAEIVTNAFLKVEIQLPDGDGVRWRTQWDFCPPLGGDLGWVECSVRLLISAEIATAKRFRIFLITGHGYDVQPDVDYDNLSMLLDGTPSKAIELPRDVQNCWGVGAEILVTPHTRSHKDFQLFNITSVEDTASDPANVVVGISSVIVAPTTAKEDPDMAVEVALLHRNVKVTGDEFDNGDKGYHFIIMNTPKVVQHIEGVLFVNGGQQGILGRYPTHFHLCSNIDGSMYARNVVRQTNQRCAVIHGSHNLTVYQNVAFDVKGHCFMLEEGGEMDNKLLFNLGAMNEPVEKVISTDESDNLPSTFWISQGQNTFIGNVAAGCQFAGYWYELLGKVRGSSVNYDSMKHLRPRTDPIQEFRDNVAHSNGSGLRTYPNGYIPLDEQVFVNSKIFRNRGSGTFFHNSRNLAMERGFIADNNRYAVDIDRLDNARLTDLRIMGYTPLYRKTNKAQNEFHQCKREGGELIGVEMHYFTMSKRHLYPGGRFENVTFTDFDGSGCDRNNAFRFDGERRWNHWDYFTLLSDFSMESSMEFVDFCQASGFLNVHDMVIFDQDEGANPNGKTGAGLSVMVSPNDHMTTFIKDSCNFYNDKCYAYCAGVCVRTITFLIESFGTEDVKLFVMSEQDDSKNFTVDSTYDFGWERFNFTDVFVSKMSLRTHESNLRRFSATLPSGNYTAKLINPDGSEYYPSFVGKILEPAPPCSGYLEDHEFNLDLSETPPATLEAACQNQIKNGDGEMANYTFWYQTSSVVGFEANAGVNNSYAIKSEGRDHDWDKLVQYLDARCLRAGHVFEFKAQFRLKNAKGEFFDCDPNTDDYQLKCPQAFMEGKKKADGEEAYYSYGLGRVGFAVTPLKPGEYNRLHGIFKMKPHFLEYDMYQLIIGGTAASTIYLDNVEFTPLNVDCSGNFLVNGDFQSDTTRWRGRYSSALSETVGVDGTGFAALAANRVNKWDGPRQDLFSDCFDADRTYEVLARFRLFDSDGNITYCDRYYEEGSVSPQCPQIGFYVNNVTNHYWPRVGSTVHSGTSDKWGVIHGIFKAEDYMEQASTMYLYVSGPPPDYDIAVDDVSIVPYTFDCSSNLIQYGDFSHEDPRAWQPWGRTQIRTLQGDSGHALWVTHRDNEGWGVTQQIPKACMSTEAMFEVTARVKLVDSNDPSVAINCLSAAVGGDLQCPTMSLRSETSPRHLYRTVAAAMGDAVDGWVTISGTFEVFYSEFQGKRMFVFISGAKAGLDMLVDDVAITPLTG